jgi:hypothetical protein
MLADYSVELGREDPALEMPWSSEDAAVCYVDLKKNPELLSEIPEAAKQPELATFLTRINAAEFPLETAKCDVWASEEILPEEEIFNAEHKFCSYVDLLFSARAARLSLERHEELARTLCKLLNHAPEIAAQVELAIRRCYYHDGGAAEADDSENGFYITAYTSAFGHSLEEARKQWTIALALLQHALVQVAGKFI